MFSEEYEDDIAYYKKEIEMNPQNGAAHKELGDIYLVLGQKEDAITCFKKAIESDLQNQWTYHDIGDKLETLGQRAAAATAFQKVIEMNPRDVHTHLKLGQNLEKSDQKEAAIAIYQKAVELRPNDWLPLLYLGVCFGEMGRYKESLDSLYQIIRMDPENGFAYECIGFALHQLGELEEAVQHLDKQLEFSPNSWTAYLKKGRALQDWKKETEAMESFQKGMDIINQGKLEGDKFTNAYGEGFILCESEIELVIAIKELLTIPTLQVTQEEPEEVKAHIQDLNQKKDALKLKFINAVISKKDGSKKQQEEEKDELNQLKKELEEVKNMYKQVAVEIAQVKADIQDSGMKELAEVKRGFKALEEQDPELLAYCKTFYWTTTNLFSAYRVMSTGLMQANFETEADQNEDLLVSGAQKASSLLADVASGIPIVGGVLNQLNSIIDGVYSAVKENRFNYKMDAINKVIQAKLGTEDDISLNVSKAALAITLAKKDAILYPEIPSPNAVPTSAKIKAGLEWLTAQIDQVKEKVLPSVQIQNSAGAALALQDVTLFIAYLCKNHESIIMRKEPLDKQILTIVRLNGLEQLLEGRADEVQVTQEVKNPEGCSCAMF